MNAKGQRIRGRYVVLESDDWGAIRTSNPKALEVLNGLGVKTAACHYTTYDAIATGEDLSALFETLKKHRDQFGHHPVITANSLMANPDFDAIKNHDFKSYHWETFTQTLERYGESLFTYWQQGIEEGVFHPQLHGREHLNLPRWMNALQSNDAVTRAAFDQGMFGISGHIVPEKRNTHLAAFDGSEHDGPFYVESIISDAMGTFKKTFGYESASFIAPNYVWGAEVEKALHQNAVKYLQGSTAQQLPSPINGQSIVRHALGQVNNLGQRYLVRNIHFEPSSSPSKNWVTVSLKEIGNAFLFQKPAIISTHRVNFIGRLNEQNRQNGLRQLDELLGRMLIKWPDIQFITSDRLGELLTNYSLS